MDEQHKALEAWLGGERRNIKRDRTFDMDDEPEASILAPFPELKRATDQIRSALYDPWWRFDNAAISSKERHRLLAQVAIGGGALAIILAILQMTLKALFATSEPWALEWAFRLECVAFVAGCLAVGFGLGAKLDRKWLVSRWQAERLRSLKFEALSWPELWCDQFDEWSKKLGSEADKIRDLSRFDALELWLESDSIGPGVPSFSACKVEPELLTAVMIYYREKRLEFQVDWFLRHAASPERSNALQRKPKLRPGLGFFLATIVAIVIHVVLDPIAENAPADKWIHEPARFGAAIALALAAVIPVVGLGLRAWTAAFEEHRSANLYMAKERAVRRDINELKAQIDDPSIQILENIHTAEFFFQNENREWLRLMRETEWFL